MVEGIGILKTINNITMKRLALFALAALIMTACNQQENHQDNTNQNTPQMKTETTINDVAGRTNFGSNHALVTTP